MNNPILQTEISTLANEVVEGKGYVVLPELLSAAEAEEARSRVFQAANSSSSENGRERVYGLIYKGEILEWMVQHPTVLAVIEAILGDDITLGGFSAHVLHPGATSMGVHVDYPYWAMKPPFPTYPILEVQVIWLVEDFTTENGSPVFAPGSQKFGNSPDLGHFDRVAQKLTGKAGSAVISHGLCWHNTSFNGSEKPRVSILGNYTPKIVHPLEENLYDFRQDVIDHASPKLKKLLRYDLKPAGEPIFKMWE